MAVHALKGQRRKLNEGGDRCCRRVEIEPEPHHAGVDLDVDFRSDAKPGSNAADGLRPFQRAHRQLDVCRKGFPNAAVTRKFEHEKRMEDAVTTELEGFFHACYRQVFGAGTHRLLGDVDRAMSIAIGLHHCHDLHLRSAIRADARHVVTKCSEIDHGPGRMRIHKMISGMRGARCTRARSIVHVCQYRENAPH